MLVGSTVSAVVPTSDPPSDEYINATLLLSLLCGCFLLLLGVARFGFITALLSETVVCAFRLFSNLQITSFTASSAFNIGGSQLKHYVGATVKSDDFLHIVIELFSPSNVLVPACAYSLDSKVQLLSAHSWYHGNPSSLCDEEVEQAFPQQIPFAK